MRYFHPLLAFASLFLCLTQSAAMAEDRPIAIALSSFKFDPSRVEMRAGQAYVLHFVNRASTAHNFVAKAFFAAAKVAPGDRTLVQRGAIELAGHQAVDVHLIAPATGKFEFHCGHFMHSTFGMTGSIEVRQG